MPASPSRKVMLLAHAAVDMKAGSYRRRSGSSSRSADAGKVPFVTGTVTFLPVRSSMMVMVSATGHFLPFGAVGRIATPGKHQHVRRRQVAPQGGAVPKRASARMAPQDGAGAPPCRASTDWRAERAGGDGSEAAGSAAEKGGAMPSEHRLPGGVSGAAGRRRGERAPIAERSEQAVTEAKRTAAPPRRAAP